MIDLYDPPRDRDGQGQEDHTPTYGHKKEARVFFAHIIAHMAVHNWVSQQYNTYLIITIQMT